jgi:hypothetical protein
LVFLSPKSQQIKFAFERTSYRTLNLIKGGGVAKHQGPNDTYQLRHVL